MKSKFSSKPYKKIVLSVFIIFLISSNIGWIKNRDNFNLRKEPFSYPFMWQYDKDAGTFIRMGAFFPEFYKEFENYPFLLLRPAYPTTARLIGEIVSFIIKPLYVLNAVEKVGIGFIILKIMVYIIGSIALFKISIRYINYDASLLATLLLLFHPYSVTSIAKFHTYELQFFIPVIVIYFYLKISNHTNIYYFILFSLLCGVLSLAKQNYAIIMALFLFLLIIHRDYYKVTIFSGVIVFPTIVWLFYLSLYDIRFIGFGNHFNKYGHELFLTSNILHSFQKIYNHIFSFFIKVVGFFSIFFIPFIASVAKNFYMSSINFRNFLFIFIFSVWFQSFIFTPIQLKSRHVADLSVVVFPIACLYISQYLDSRYDQKIKIKIYYGIIIIWGLLTLINLVTFPWISPFKQ